MLLDSLEAIDADYLVVVLPSEDTAALDQDYHRITDI
jgi:hypothetical protein